MPGSAPRAASATICIAVLASEERISGYQERTGTLLAPIPRERCLDLAARCLLSRQQGCRVKRTGSFLYIPQLALGILKTRIYEARNHGW